MTASLDHPEPYVLYHPYLEETTNSPDMGFCLGHDERRMKFSCCVSLDVKLRISQLVLELVLPYFVAAT